MIVVSEFQAVLDFRLHVICDSSHLIAECEETLFANAVCFKTGKTCKVQRKIEMKYMTLIDCHQ